MTLLDAAALCIKIAGKGKIDIQDRDMAFPSRGRLNTDRARSELGFNPIVNAKEGFKRYHQWFLESRYWQTKL
jgi:nucleoside-diphosphate-sugar epimerase